MHWACNTYAVLLFPFFPELRGPHMEILLSHMNVVAYKSYGFVISL